MDTFPTVQRKDEARFGEYCTKRVILDICDRMQHAIASGQLYQMLPDPPPADPRVAHAALTHRCCPVVQGAALPPRRKAGREREVQDLGSDVQLEGCGRPSQWSGATRRVRLCRKFGRGRKHYGSGPQNNDGLHLAA